MTNAGWYPDPADERVMRYWDGVEWKDQRVLNVPAHAAEAAPVAEIAPAATPVPSVAPAADTPASPFSTVQTLVERIPLTKTAMILFSGVAVAAVGVLMPWEHDTLSLSTITRGPTSSAGGAVFLFALLGVVGWLAWPSRTGELSKKRRVAIAVLAGVLGFFVLAKFASLAHANANAQAQAAKEDSGLFPGLGSATEIHYGVGFGLFVYAAGVITIAIGVSQHWIVRMRDVVRRSR